MPNQEDKEALTVNQKVSTDQRLGLYIAILVMGTIIAVVSIVFTYYIYESNETTKRIHLNGQPLVITNIVVTNYTLNAITFPLGIGMNSNILEK